MLVGASKEQLTGWRTALEVELRDTEAKIGPLQSTIRELRSQIQAIDTLMKPLVPPSNAKSAQPLRASDNEGEEFTPTGAYWNPILESLEELGGRGRTDEVLDLVEKKMAGILKPKDYELLPSGISVRWKNRAQWQRQNMVHKGLIADNSPRGTWEITPGGSVWLEQGFKP